MGKVLAYGPEILALEDHFNGETIILDGYQRYFTAVEDNLYCNFINGQPDRWMVARVYNLSKDDQEIFKNIYPQEYKKRHIEVKDKYDELFFNKAITYTKAESEKILPISEPKTVTYTLFENLSIAVSDAFAYKFALSTYDTLNTSETEVFTSYYSNLDEIDLLKCRREILTYE